MNRRKFLGYMGCGCCSLMLPSCATAPITERRQLKLINEAKLNAHASNIYEKVKKKEKMSDDEKTLNQIKEIGKRMEDSISEYFHKNNMDDPTINFEILKKAAQQLNLNELSMGMSNDYEIAAHHGSTYLRLGTAIFGNRNT